MSERVIKELSKASKEVNQTIEESFEQPMEPKALYDASRHLIRAGGKRVRPFLVLESCTMVGGRRVDGLPVAAAVEFVHNFTLVHDDIMDRDEKRRGVPTVHARWGLPIAISAGDLLFAKAYQVVLSSLKHKGIPHRRILRIIGIITEAAISVCEGQALDILFESRERISEVEYFRMISKKTASLLEASAMAGAVTGGGSEYQVEALGGFAYYSGLAFQLIDDCLGLMADEETLGKPVGSDIREGKRTLIIINALDRASKGQREQIRSILGDGEASVEELQEAIDLIRSLTSIDYAVEQAEKMVMKAKGHLSTFPQSPEKEILLKLADYIVSRRY